jgi:hypothetical protein
MARQPFRDHVDLHANVQQNRRVEIAPLTKSKTTQMLSEGVILWPSLRVFEWLPVNHLRTAVCSHALF